MLLKRSRSMNGVRIFSVPIGVLIIDFKACSRQCVQVFYNSQVLPNVITNQTKKFVNKQPNTRLFCTYAYTHIMSKFQFEKYVHDLP